MCAIFSLDHVKKIITQFGWGKFSFNHNDCLGKFFFTTTRIGVESLQFFVLDLGMSLDLILQANTIGCFGSMWNWGIELGY